jgi:hypothetical protein
LQVSAARPHGPISRTIRCRILNSAGGQSFRGPATAFVLPGAGSLAKRWPDGKITSPSSKSWRNTSIAPSAVLAGETGAGACAGADCCSADEITALKKTFPNLRPPDLMGLATVCSCRKYVGLMVNSSGRQRTDLITASFASLERRAHRRPLHRLRAAYHWGRG